MEAVQIQSASPELGVRASRSAPIIIATDGQEQSDAALIVGRLLAEVPEAFRLVTVVKSTPVLPEADVGVIQEIDASCRAVAKQDVLAQALRTWGEVHDVEVREGDPAFSIARLAHQTGATMIVAGLGRHRVVDRFLGDETALRLMRLSDVPVLAAANGLTHAPNRVVVACDFSETSLRGARLAIELAAPNATIYLVHVTPRGRSPHEWTRAYTEDAGRALQKTRDQLRVPSDMVAQNVVLQGDPATEILAFAGSVNADLIATGSNGNGFVARMLIGSVTTRIVRGATCSVLSVPHAAAMTGVRTAADPVTSRKLSRDAWVEELDDFTRRNLGRKGVLEVDDAEIGAQAQEFDYPLLGATFDRHDQRVDLMFGEVGQTGRRLSRGISGITSIDVLEGDRGRDLAIRIEHGAGQTLLTFDD